MHTTEARRRGETEQRLYLIDAWRDSPLYSERERAALAWTEALTRLSETDAPDDAYHALETQFSKEEQVALTLVIVAINGWNRINVGFRLVHPVAERKAALLRNSDDNARQRLFHVHQAAGLFRPQRTTPWPEHARRAPALELALYRCPLARPPNAPRAKRQRQDRNRHRGVPGHDRQPRKSFARRPADPCGLALGLAAQGFHLSSMFR
jgi:hypothetical protein